MLAALSAVLAAVLATPALAQLAVDAPSPPEYQVQDDGTLVIGGDVVGCAQIGLEDPYLEAGGPEARACEAAGFGTADDPSPGGVPDSGSASSSWASAGARTLPKTGGSALPALLMAASIPLAAGCLLAWRTTRQARRAP